MTELIGQTIGDYQVEAPLGAKSTGQLFRARHVRLDQPAAMQVLDARLTAVPDFQTRFLDALGRALALRHEHIVKIFDFGTHDTLYYVAMEWVADGSLRTEHDRRRREKAVWPLAVSLNLVEQVADGLAYAHRQGVFHGAISPGNLLLRYDGTGDAEAYTLKISDFGLAGLIPAEVLQEPTYLSPEQCRGLAIDGRSDIYSLGVVLYELVVGVPPFKITTVAEAVEKHTRVEPTPPRRVRPQLPIDLEAIILRCLAKRPDDRFADAGALADALREFERQHSSAQTTALGNQPLTPAVTPAQAGDPLLSGLLGAAARPNEAFGGERIGVHLDPVQIEIIPGESAVIRATLANHGSTADSLALSVVGVPSAWVRGPEEAVQLSPGAQVTIPLTIDVPSAPDSLAGDYNVIARVRSGTHPNESSTAHATWTILPFSASDMLIAPNTTSGRTEAQYQVTLRNEGNTTTSYLLLADDDNQALRYTFAQNQISLDPGQMATVALTVQAPQSWFGSDLPRDFDVRAEIPGGVATSATAQFVQQALIPMWIPLVLAVLLFVAVLVNRVLPSTGVGVADTPTVVAPTALSTEAPTATPEPGAPNITLFEVEPQVVAPGQVVIVAWDVQGAERVTIDQFGDVPPRGKREQRLEQTTDFRLVATGGGKESVRIERVSVVTPTTTAAPTEAPTPTPEPGAPNIVLFAVEPQVVAPGQIVIVAWDVQGAERVTIDQFGDVPPQGQREHRPEQTTDFRLVATGGGAEVVRIERVSVVAPTSTAAPTKAPTNTPLPTVELTSTPLPPAAPVNLLDLAPSALWSTTNGDRVPFGQPPSGAERGGWADFASNVTLEDGQQYPVSLYTFPPIDTGTTPRDAADGPFIEGQFDLRAIQPGQFFLADIGFAQGSQNPGASVRISFSGEVFYEGLKQPDGRLLAISVDLSRFAGRAGRLDIRVTARGGPALDGLYWIQPRIDLPS